MTEKYDPDAGFSRLWPTILLQRNLPGCEEPNTALNKLIKQREKLNEDLTTDYLDEDILANEHPAAAWLKRCIDITIRDYLDHVGMKYPIQWDLQSWANINRFGDYHDLHNHPHAYLSGTYYVRMPQHYEKLKSRKDVRPGRITFYDPRGAVNMTAIRDDPNIEAEFTLEPRPGLVLLWPAFLHHFVHPNLSKQPRVSISFNVVLKWSNEYLPKQV